MLQILKQSPLFSHIDDRTLEELSAVVSLRTVAANEMIFLEGEVAASFYLVGSGKVKVFKLSSEGKEQILLIAGPGESFAEAAMFAGRRYPASAQALHTTELAVIDRGRFVALLGSRPELAMSLIARLAELLRKMTILVEGLSLSDVNTRLARYLCSYRDEKTGLLPQQIKLQEKKTVLASQLGTIPETLSRALAKLVKDEIIAVDGPTITLLNPEALEALAESGN